MNRLVSAVAVVVFSAWIGVFTSGPLWAKPQSKDDKDRSEKTWQTSGQVDRQGKASQSGQKGGKHQQAQSQDRGPSHGKGQPGFTSGGGQQGLKQGRKAAGKTRSAAVGKSQTGRSKAAGHHFDDRARNAVRRYFSEHWRSGHCPPGLVRNGKRCEPPRAPRKWAVGKQLPRGVIFYDLPPRVIEVLGPPPPRHRYVRVANDILLITTGIGMVVDAIADLQAIQ